MNEDPLNRYQSMMNDTHAPAHLPEQVLEQARAQSAASASANATRSAKPVRPTAAPVFSAKRTRVKGFAIAACAVLALGAGALALSPLALSSNNNGGADTTLSPSFANPFGLAVAEAAEPGQSIALSTDESGISLAGNGGFDIRFAMNLTCAGESIKHLSYAIEGDDVRFMGFDISQDASQPVMDTPAQFEVDYDDQNPEGLRREILVNTADPAITENKQQISDLHRQLEATEDPDAAAALQDQLNELSVESTELNNAYYGGDLMSGKIDNNTWFASKVTEAAQKLANATLSVTATFTDGTTATKNYRIAPVEDFEQKCKTFLDVSFTPDHDENDPALATPLFTITELS